MCITTDTKQEKAVIKDVSQQKRRKILIVDDNTLIMDSFTTFFIEQGFIVIQAEDGADGIKKASETLPDLILMDVNMPVLNGLESTRIIKSHPNTKHLPIFMFTVEGEKDIVVKAIQAGAKDYIIKTMDKKFVLKRIQRFFDGND